MKRVSVVEDEPGIALVVEDSLRLEVHDVKTPVIFLSERAQVSDRVHGPDLGANDYVVKPFSPDELMARVRRHLQHEDEIRDNYRHLEDEIRAASEVQDGCCHEFAAIPGLDYAAICRLQNRWVEILTIS